MQLINIYFIYLIDPITMNYLLLVNKDLLSEVDRLKIDYLNNIKSMDSDTRVQQLKLIEKKFDKCRELSDEKVQLANQTYEMVIRF